MTQILISGIYDLRTLKSIQNESIKNFAFDFNPKSHTFIQEYVFKNLLQFINSNEFVFIKCKNNEDYFIQTIISDLNNSSISLNRYCFIFDDITSKINDFKYPFMTYYQVNNIKIINSSEYLVGLIFNFDYLEKLFLDNTLNQFYNNLFLSFKKFSHLKLVLDSSWNDSLITVMNDLFEFNYFIYNINNNVEVCYRNVNLVKLKTEINLKKKELTI